MNQRLLAKFRPTHDWTIPLLVSLLFSVAGCVQPNPGYTPPYGPDARRSDAVTANDGGYNDAEAVDAASDALPAVDGASDGRADSNPPCDTPDTSSDRATAVILQDDIAVTDQLCPKGDEDFFVLPSGNGSVVALSLSHQGSDAAESLSYRLTDASDTVIYESVTAQPSWTRLHCLDSRDTYLVVNDSPAAPAQGAGSYAVRAVIAANPDPLEPNDTPDTAAEITIPFPSANQTGAIACVGDQDYYTFELSADRLLVVDLRPSNVANSQLQLSYRLVDQKNQQIVAEDDINAANIGPVPYGLPAGKYQLVVSNRDETYASLTDLYQLTLRTVREPDVNDQGARNDRPDTATLLGSYSGPGAETFASQTGRIASLGDNDFFRIDGINFTHQNPGVISAVVTFAGNTGVAPLVQLFRSDPQTSCSTTLPGCCATQTVACADDLECLQSSQLCVARSAPLCQLFSTADPSTINLNVCGTALLGANRCLAEKGCLGSRYCIPATAQAGDDRGSCAVLWSQRSSGAERVPMTQPLYEPGPWFIRVADASGVAYDYTTDYQLDVKITADPDQGEPDNQFFSYTLRLRNDANALNAARFTDFTPHPPAGGSPDTAYFFNGVISYDGDVDRHIVANPCTASRCSAIVSLNTSGNCAAIDIQATLFADEPVSLSPGCNFGAAASQCLLVDGLSSELEIIVETTTANGFDWDCAYKLTLGSFAPIASDNSNCPAGCATNGNGSCSMPGPTACP